MQVVLRLGSMTLDLEPWCDMFPPEVLLAFWRPGDRRGLRVADSFGMNVLLADEEDGETAIATSEATLRSLCAQVQQVVESGARATVDIGIEVSGVRPGSVRLGDSLLKLLLLVGASLEVSAYPCSDE